MSRKDVNRVKPSSLSSFVAHTRGASRELCLLATLLLIGAGSGACSSVSASKVNATPAPSGAPIPSGAPVPSSTPFQAAAPAAYVAKLKNVLVGLPPSADEVSQVDAAPNALKELVVAWQQLPEYRSKMQRFFELAFQQTQISITDFTDQSYPKQLVINTSTAPRLVQNAEQSFARTMLELNAEGRPFTDCVTSQKLLMTTALKELYAFLDVWQVDDNGKVTDGFKLSHPKLSVVAEAAQGPIPLSDTLDPTSPQFMHWYDPDVANAGAKVAECGVDPILFPSSAFAVHRLLYGSLDGWKTTTGVSCPPIGGSATSAQLTESDFNDWQLVTLRAPGPGEASTPFYDLNALRSAKELVLSVPRIGFFTTPAFFANWQTNISNQMRVTLNQSLIVALGAQVDGTDTTQPTVLPPPGLDTAHAGGGACFNCHQTLDPLRSIFSANYSFNYHNQIDPALSAEKGLFSFQGINQPVASMAEFGGVLGAHPLFAAAWVQKLCFYANSAPCSTTDPEFLRVVALFQSSNFAWDTLVKELFSSPLVTFTARTQTSDTNGEVLSVARRDHLCAAFDNRLGFSDICGREAVTAKQARALIPAIAAGLPSDGYGRGSTAAVLPNQPTLFYRAGLENICEALAAQTIDVAKAKQVPNVKQWSSSDADSAIAEFVSLIMALTPEDPRTAPATELLKGHFAQAVQGGATPSDALKSTFITACLAPSAISVGL